MSYAGTRLEGDHVRYFDETGTHPGKFADREAARWGSWATPEDVARINGGEDRLITMADLREIINRRTTQPPKPSEVRDAE